MRYSSTLRAMAPGSWGECQDCRAICRAETIRERESDGKLVCRACDQPEPYRFQVVEVTKPSRLSSPVTLPEHPTFPDPSPALVDDLGFDMRQEPNYR